MTYSVRDLAIVTAYSALILARSEFLNAAVITASVAALALLVFLFGIKTFGAILHPRRRSRTLLASLPLLAVLVSWVLVLVVAMVVFDTSTATVDLIALATMSSTAAASVPFLFNMEVRQQELSDRTLWIGYWTHCVAMVSGGFAAIGLETLRQHTQCMDAAYVLRLAPVCGILASVFGSWWLLARERTVDEPGDGPTT